MEWKLMLMLLLALVRRHRLWQGNRFASRFDLGTKRSHASLEYMRYCHVMPDSKLWQHWLPSESYVGWSPTYPLMF
jgi:hypothetical protein